MRQEPSVDDTVRKGIVLAKGPEANPISALLPKNPSFVEQANISLGCCWLWHVIEK